MAHALEQIAGAVRRQGRPRDDTCAGRMDVDIKQRIVARHQPFGEAEPLDQIDDIVRRRHQHGIARAIIFDRDGHFARQGPVDRCGRIIAGQAQERLGVRNEIGRHCHYRRP